MPADNVTIQFYRDGELFAVRYWSQVPRRGDEVMLGGSPPMRDAYVVRRVVWGVEGPIEARNGTQVVSIEIDRLPS